MNRCKACGKILWSKGKGVIVVKARPNDDASSLMLSGQEKLAISTLNGLERFVDAGDIKSDVIVCRHCWTVKLEPPQLAEIDLKIAAFESTEHSTPAVEMMPLGILTAKYYVSRLTKLLEDSTSNDVKGWVLFCAANRLQNYSKEFDEITEEIMLPRVSELTRHPDRDVSWAAKCVLKAFDGQLPFGEWKTYPHTDSWNGFKNRLP